MDTERLRELARYAQQATPGPWETVQYAGIHQPGDNRDNPPIAATYTHNRDADEAYIAAASPDVILALLDRLREPPTTLVIPDSEVLSERQAQLDASEKNQRRIAELEEGLRRLVDVLGPATISWADPVPEDSLFALTDARSLLSSSGSHGSTKGDKE